MNPSQIAGRASAPEADNKLVDALVRACAIIIGERQMLVDSYTEAGGVQVSPDAQDDLERFDEVLKAADEALAAHQAAPTLTPEPPSQPVAADAPAEVVHCERNDAFKSALMATGRVANFDPRGRPRAAPVEVQAVPEPCEWADRARRLAEDFADDCVRAGYVTTSAKSHAALVAHLAGRPVPAAEAGSVDFLAEVIFSTRYVSMFVARRIAEVIYTRPAAPLSEVKRQRLKRGSTGVCSRSVCACERDGLGDECVWLSPVTLRPTPSNERG